MRIGFNISLAGTALRACAIVCCLTPAAALAQFQSTPVPEAIAGTPYAYAAVAGGLGTVVITAPEGLPPWLTLTATGNGTATLAGTPLEGNTQWPILLRAEDDICRPFPILCATQPFTITVAAVSVNGPPVVVPPGIGDQLATIGVPLAVDLAPAFADPDADPLSFSVVGLPAGFLLDGATIQGTASSTQGSPHTIEVTASDGRGGTATLAFLLTIVAANTPPAVAAPPLADQTFTVGDPIAIDVAPGFTDPDGDPLSFTASGLPPWLLLSGTTIVGSAPTTVGSPHRIAIEAADGRGGTVTDEILLTIRPLATADIGITGIAVTPSAALRGATIEWRIAIENRGPEPSGSSTLTLDFSGIALGFTAPSCSAPPAGGPQSLSCTVNSLPAGSAATVTVQATAAQHGDAWLAATLAAPALPIDPSAANNSAVAAVNVGETIAAVPAQRIAGGSVVAVAAAEFDGAGGTDLVAAGTDGRILLYRRGESPAGLAAELSQPGTARIGLMAAETLLTGTAARSLALADLDGDSLPELAFAAGPGVASAVHRNSGNGQLARVASLGTAAADDRAIAARDIDGNGRVDLVVAGDSIRAYLNSGNPATLTQQLIGPASGTVTGLALVQLVGSPLPDVVVAYANSPVVVHENLDGRTFRVAASLGGGTTGLGGGDFNRDGREDLLVSRAAAAAPPARVVYLANGSSSLPVAAELGASLANALAVADVGGDGVADFFSVNATGAHQLYSGNGNGGFTLNGRLLVSANSLAVASGAFSRDDRVDLVVAGTEGVSVFFDDGLGGFGLGDSEPPVIALTGAREIALDIGSAYTDAGAVASDNVDGQFAATVDNPVDPMTVGTYTVTYTAVDSAGNAAENVTRTVRVAPRTAAGGSGGGGGGGAADLSMLLVLLVTFAVSAVGRRRSCGRSSS